MNLKGKVAVVTGASDGLGKQVALKLGALGVDLALIARSKTNLEKTREEILKTNPKAKVKVYPCDITKTATLAKTITQITTDFSAVHILLNIAGIWQKKAQLDEIPEEVVDKVIATDLTGLVHCTRLVLPYLRCQPEAAIINVSSSSGVTAQEGQSVYSAAKWGVAGFTEVLRADLKNTGVRIAGVYQRGTNTQMFNKVGEGFSQEELNTFIDPADLADVIVFILSQPEKIWLHDVRVEY